MPSPSATQVLVKVYAAGWAPVSALSFSLCVSFRLSASVCVCGVCMFACACLFRAVQLLSSCCRVNYIDTYVRRGLPPYNKAGLPMIMVGVVLFLVVLLTSLPPSLTLPVTSLVLCGACRRVGRAPVSCRTWVRASLASRPATRWLFAWCRAATRSTFAWRR